VVAVSCASGWGQLVWDALAATPNPKTYPGAWWLCLVPVDGGSWFGMLWVQPQTLTLPWGVVAVPCASGWGQLVLDALGTTPNPKPYPGGGVAVPCASGWGQLVWDALGATLNPKPYPGAWWLCLVPVDGGSWFGMLWVQPQTLNPTLGRGGCALCQWMGAAGLGCSGCNPKPYPGAWWLCLVPVDGGSWFWMLWVQRERERERERETTPAPYGAAWVKEGVSEAEATPPPSGGGVTSAHPPPGRSQ
jgi:hypothetical protein